MMNPIIQSLYDRKSCRIFKDKEISQKERQLILEACMPGTECRKPTNVYHY